MNEYHEILDVFFLINGDFSLPLVDGDSWTTERAPTNHSRGDLSSVDQLDGSIWDVGLLSTSGCGPFLMRRFDNGKVVENRYWALHFATRLTAVRNCWMRDKDKTNIAVQLSLRAGVGRCKLYSHEVTADQQTFLVEMGNLNNDKVTGTTILQAWRATKEVSEAFAKRRVVMSWTIASLGQSKYDSLKFQVADGLYKGYWADYVTLERCTVFYRTAMEER